MSRSYRKCPIVKDNQRGGARIGKRMAASRIRNIDNTSEEASALTKSPSLYKKINQDTYEIHDYVSRWTEEEARKYWREVYSWEEECAYRAKLLKKYPTEDDYITYFWAKCMKRK